MPSERCAHPGPVAGPNRGFNVTSRAALAACAAALTASSPARAAAPGWEPPVTGTIVGLELGVLAAAILDAREPSAWAWCVGVGGAVGLGAGAAFGAARTEPEAPLTLRAAALGLAIPTAILVWTRLAEPPSAAASEDASPLAPPRAQNTR
jgi:hypothetical protein